MSFAESLHGDATCMSSEGHGAVAMTHDDDTAPEIITGPAGFLAHHVTGCMIQPGGSSPGVLAVLVMAEGG